MTALLFALLAAFATTMGARDQVVVADLGSHGSRLILPLAIVGGCVTAVLAGGAAILVLPYLVPDARAMLGAMALAVSGLELILLRPARAPKEPTQSVAAAAIVLLAHQLTDTARFMAFGIAAATAAPWPAAIGCAAGGSMALAIGALGGIDPRLPLLRKLRIALGIGFLLIGFVIGFSALPD